MHVFVLTLGKVELVVKNLSEDFSRKWREGDMMCKKLMDEYFIVIYCN